MKQHVWSMGVPSRLKLAAMKPALLAGPVGLGGCFAGLLLLLSGCQDGREQPTVKTAAEPIVARSATAAGLSPASDANPFDESQVKLQVLDTQGLEQLIASHRGKVVVMDAWSTACPPCIKEFPGLVRLHHRYGPDRLACISLSLDYEGVGSPHDVEPDVLRFLRRQRATFDNVLASLESDQMLKKLGVYSIPAVFIYDRTGKLVKRFDSSSGEEFTYHDVEVFLTGLM
ncbi:MAG: TlpA disulfide reductase family protein [Pirellulales bacterium]